MALKQRVNDVSFEAQPGIWIFRGPWVTLFVAGAGTGIGIFRLLSVYDVDLLPNLAISLAPLAAITAFVVLLVNDRSPSYALDFFLWRLFCLKLWAYREGLTDRPPQLWRSGRLPFNPSTLDSE
jgi:hypothetical protein